MLDTPRVLDDYSLTQFCPKHGGIDPLNRKYVSKNKMRQISGSYQRRVAIRRRTGIDFDLDVVPYLQRSAQDRLFARLDSLAKDGDIDAFVRTLQRVKWEDRRASEFVRVIRLALDVSAPAAARHLFVLGQKYHPNNPYLSVYSKLFGESPRASIRALPANNTLKANREWLKEHRIAYRGQWIALKEGELLATGSSLDDLRSKISDVSNTLLTRA